MRNCGFCRQPGHTIVSCLAPGAAEERQQRVAKREQKSYEKIEAEKVQFSVSINALDLSPPSVCPGCLHSSYALKCRTVNSVLDVVFPVQLITVLLSVMNQNLEKKNAKCEVRSAEPSNKKR